MTTVLAMVGGGALVIVIVIIRSIRIWGRQKFDGLSQLIDL